MTQRAAVFVIGSPVAGYLRPANAPFIPGNFRVSCSFACHKARTPPKEGIDIGNGRCGDPIYAEHAGFVSLAGLLGTAKVVRIDHPNGTDQSGYAHLATIEVSKGQSVARGRRVGTLGMTGATACHLHGGYKRNGVEIDWWPLLEQNHAVQVNAGAVPNLRATPAGAVIATVRLKGIYNLAGVKVADHDALMAVRGQANVTMALAGTTYEWVPRKVGTLNFWVARNFIHYV